MVALTLCHVPSLVTGENRTFTSTLEATPLFIHYTEGYLIAPGMVDLSGLVFTVEDDDFYESKDRTKDESDGGGGKGAGMSSMSSSTTPAHDDDTGDDDDLADFTDDDDYVNGDDDGDGNGDRRTNWRYLKSRTSNTVVDIVVFKEPNDCANSQKGCDWTKLGVGSTDEEGNLRWCCSKEAAEDLKLCKGKNDLGRLIINETLFEGEHRAIMVASSGAHEMRVPDSKIDVLEDDGGNGNYVMVLANCNENGRDVDVAGWYAWKSQHGYLPGDLFGAMDFYFILVIVYSVLLIWYTISMYCNRDATIPIQRYICLTILLGFLETFFKAGDFWVWNEDGTRFWFAMYIGVMLGVAKRALSRVLVLMVSLGWGVVRDTLGDEMTRITSLGIFYFAASTARDILAIVAVVDMKTISYEDEEEIIDVVTILTFIIAACDVTFYMWILDALNGTMDYLQNLNQHTKLLRYLRLRLVLLISILFAVAWAIFGLVDTYMDESILYQDAEWAISGAWELNYLMVLVSVAILWRPNPHAKDYASVMELPSTGGDIEFSTNDGIELDDTPQMDTTTTEADATATPVKPSTENKSSNGVGESPSSSLMEADESHVDDADTNGNSDETNNNNNFKIT